MNVGRGLIRLALAGAVSVAVAAALMVINRPPPVPLLSAAEAADASRPYVVKLHARWCPICMVTRGAWTEIQHAYGDRVKFVVFDFTDAKTTEASRTEAHRIGLDAVFDDHEGETGTVVVVDGASRRERDDVHGVHSAADYRTMIDAALAGPRP